MYLRRLKLVNYGGIYNGLGLEEIEIDFTRCQHRIILVKGDNGSGKSTIVSALKPLTDDNISFIPGKNARKEIEYYDEKEDVIYKIVFIHDAISETSRKTARGFIYRIDKMGQANLNPSGNISDCKKVIYSELSLDSNYITLVQLSNTKRGIADLKPAERKKYVSEILNSSETYNGMYKKFSSLASELKGKLDAINAKIKDVGNVIDLEQKVASYDRQIAEAEANIDHLNEMMNQWKGTLIKIDPDDKVMHEIKMFQDSREIHEDKLKACIASINAAYKRLPEIAGITPTQEMLAELEATKDQLEQEDKVYKAKIDTINASRESKSADLREKEAKLESVSSGFSMSDIRITLTNLKDKKQAIIDRWGCIVKLDNLSASEFISAYEAIKQIIDILNQRVKVFPEQEIQRIYYDTVNKINAIDTEIEQVVEENNRIMTAEDKVSILDNRPANCKNDACPFIADALKARAMIESFKRHPKTLSQLNSDKDALNKVLQMIELNKTMISIYNVNQRLLRNLNYGLDTYDMAMTTLVSNGASILSTISSMISYVEDIDEYSTLDARIQEITTKYNSLSAQEDIINMLIEDINRLNQQISTDMDTVAMLNSQRSQNNTTYSIVRNKYMALSDIFTLKAQEAENEESIRVLDQEIAKRQTNIEDIKKAKSEIEKIGNEIKRIKELLDPLRQEREEYRYKYKRSIEYHNELNQYQRNFDKINELKRFCSPTTGIQLMFSRMYFSNIIKSANRILSGLFNGEFALMPLIASENEFKIPVAVSGGLNHDDITSMSSAQIALISMIISVSLLSQTSTKLNIIVGDEIDAPFDSDNRRKFIEILYKLMDLVGANQSVLISHNSEIDTSDCDVILLKSTDQFNEGNIIWSY